MAGDPAGRRIARRRAGLIAEARLVVLALKILLKRAEYKLEDCESLERQLGALEYSELHRAYGRIEPRRRFTGHPSHTMVQQRPRSVLFIDESGKSFPEPKVVRDPQVFALAGIALTETEVDNYVAAANEIKLRYFGKTEVTFHEPHMRHGEGLFKFADRNEAAAFDADLDHLVEATPFTAFGVAIRKKAFTEFTDGGIDPYLPTDAYSVAILMLLERYVDFLATSPIARFGRVVFESQGKKEDAFHQLEYARHMCDGSQWIPETVFQDWVQPGLTFVPKHGSDPTELADMFSRDLFEWVRDGCATTPKRWKLFSQKIYCREDGLMGKFGLKVFPDSDIREAILVHRIECGAQEIESA